MKPRPMSPPPASSHAEPDLDSTAELPVLDPARAAAAAAGERHATTDTLAAPPTPPATPATPPADAAPSATTDGAEAARRLETSLQSLTAALQAESARLREAQELLAAKGARLTQLERARDEARAALADAEQRAAAAEQRATAFEQSAAAFEQTMATLSTELAEPQGAAAQPTTEPGEAQQAPAAAEQRAARLQEAIQARAAAEQRAAAAADRLAEARALVSAASERRSLLQRRVEELESENRTQRTNDAEQLKALAAQDRAHADGMMADLHHERARAVTYFEALQSLEGRRLIGEHLVTDLQREVEAREADLRRLARDLAGRDSRARTHGAEIAQRAERIARLEQQVSSLTATLGQRDTQLRDSRHEAEGLRASIARLQGELTSGGQRRHELEEQLEQHHRAVSQQLGELQRLRSERTELHAAGEAARSAAAAAAAQTAAHEAALAQQGEHAARLDAALAAERQRAGQLEGELATVRGEMQDWGPVLRSAQQERGGHLAAITAAEARVQALELAAAEHRQSVITLQAENAAHETRARELEANLRAAEDTVHRLEADARNRSARIGERDTAASATLEAPRLAEEPAAVEPAPDGATRLLIYGDGGREIVHVLGRKTSIGRTPDNDLQIEAKFVSRHHAVILAGPAQTIVEDLNSTNGVLVNGRRITRQTLKDGDEIVIGRAHYRFAVRKGGGR